MGGRPFLCGSRGHRRKGPRVGKREPSPSLPFIPITWWSWVGAERRGAMHPTSNAGARLILRGASDHRGTTGPPGGGGDVCDTGVSANSSNPPPPLLRIRYWEGPRTYIRDAASRRWDGGATYSLRSWRQTSGGISSRLDSIRHMMIISILSGAQKVRARRIRWLLQEVGR